jgi:hypothetical protein
MYPGMVMGLYPMRTPTTLCAWDEKTPRETINHRARGDKAGKY